MKSFLEQIQQASTQKTKSNAKKKTFLSTNAGEFKKVMRNAKKRTSHAPLPKVHCVRSKNIHALKSSKRLYRIAELQLVVRQLRLKAMSCADSDLINAQLAAAQDELFRLMAKYKT
ncbi:hypothetical protein LJC56_09270 [Christensenellaceae bacterium OttesenSCG-928-K19]|nr:hypothetical protein [Christensenellaceae bacterium OttesenSCG-928-K19]